MILLTGATGFIGSHLLARAASQFDFRCLVRPASRSRVRGSGKIEIVEGDLLSEDAVRRAVQGADTVLHLAALIRRDSPENIFRVNVEGTRLLVSEARKAGVRRFIFVSTENALREDLDDAYAVSKRRAEEIVAGFPGSLILRPCFVYGRGDDHGLGRLIEMLERSPIVPLFGGLKARIQPVSIEDMVEYLVRALRSELKGAYVIAGPEAIGLNDFLKAVARARKKRRLFIPVPYALFKVSALLCQTLPRRAGWGMAQLNNIYGSRTYPIERTVRDFGHSPRPVEAGLAEWLR